VSKTSRGAAVLALAAALSAASNASAATQWSAPATIAAAQSPAGARDVSSPVVASDAAGNLTAIWLGGNDATWGVYSASKPASGTWTAPSRIGTGSSLSTLSLTVSPNGHAVAAWPDRRSYRTATVVSASRTPGGVWSAPTDVQTTPEVGPAGYTDEYSVAVSDTGAATAIWYRQFIEELHYLVRGTEFGAADLPVGASTWTPRPALGAHATGLRLGIDADGNATLIFSDENGDLRTASKPAGGAWTAPTVLLPAGTPTTAPARGAQLAENAAGTVVVVWQRSADDGTVIESTRHVKGSGWSPVERVAAVDPTYPIGGLQAGIDATGRATVAWTTLKSTGSVFTSELEATSEAPGATWDAQTTVASQTTDVTGISGSIPELRSARLATGAGGTTTLSWTEESTTTDPQQLFAATRRPGSAWESPVPIASGPAVNDSSIVTDPQGTATTVWPSGHTLLASTTATTPPSPSSTTHVNASATLSGLGAKTCPAKVVVTAGATKASLPATRVGTGRLRCRVSGSVAVKARAGSYLLVTISAKGLAPAVSLARVAS
jgi:hypothetical protein